MKRFQDWWYRTHAPYETPLNCFLAFWVVRPALALYLAFCRVWTAWTNIP